MKDILKVGITIGDVNGIGLEVILKSLAHEAVLSHFTPVIYGSAKVVTYHKNILPHFSQNLQFISSASVVQAGQINVVNCWQDILTLNLGERDSSLAKYPMIALEQAVNDHKQGLIDCLVTAPIDKELMTHAGFAYPGHTEYLGSAYEANPLMLMVYDRLKVAVATGHIPLREVPVTLSSELILSKIKQLSNSLTSDFGITRPTIAVLGLNPHAGDQGRLGSEDQELIRPAIVRAKQEDIIVMGPFAADGFFASGQYTKFDGILAMYHDQGLIPFKLLSQQMGVNFTAGLPLVRTSPDHGTAFDIAGKGIAKHESFLQAIYAAIDIYNFRRLDRKLRSNELKKMPKPSEDSNA